MGPRLTQAPGMLFATPGSVLICATTNVPTLSYNMAGWSNDISRMESESSDPSSDCFPVLIKPISYVLFNRQPSLHKMSMMSHRVKIMAYSSKLISHQARSCAHFLL